MKAKITLSAEKTISAIDDRLYSSFIEHMGRAIYTGIYEPEHPTADENGFRQDVADLIKPLKLSHIRYPGGNFVSGYRWEDGIGDRKNRPVRRELAWFALEPNQVGTNEFADYCSKLDISPMMAVNLGTRGPQEAADLLEYCNVSGGSYYSDLRRSHGWTEPHNIGLWCLGNEMDGPWQICAKTAEEYARTACETAKMMKWMDPSVELVACGSSFLSMPTFGEWERTVLRHCYEHIDYLSLHQYYTNEEQDIGSFLARSMDMDNFVKTVAGICAEAKREHNSDKDIYLSFDEWNVWYHYRQSGAQPEKWTVARPIEEELYDFADALLVGSMLITLINNSDTVKIACLAQLVNVIAPIMTEPGGKAWVQTIYHPFMHTSVNGRGTALRPTIECPTYKCAVSDHAPYIDCAAVVSDDQQTVTLFVVNKNLSENATLEIDINGFLSAGTVQHTSLTAPSIDSVSTADSDCVSTSVSTFEFSGSATSMELPAASWNMITIMR